MAFSLAGNSEKQWRVSTCEGRESWGIDPSAPSVLTSGLLWSHFPSTLACHVHGQSNQGNPSGKETQRLAAGRPAGKEKVQPKSHGGRGTPTASAARPESVSCFSPCQAGRLEAHCIRLRPFLPDLSYGGFATRLSPPAQRPSALRSNKASWFPTCHGARAPPLLKALSVSTLPIFFTSPSALPTAGLRTSHLASGMGRGPLPPTHGDLKPSIFLPGTSPSPTGHRRSPWPLITRVNSPPSLARASLGRGYYNENPLKDYLILQTHTPAARIQSK